MISLKKNKGIIFIFFILVIAAIFGIISDYNLYSLSLNGRVQNTRKTIKEVMYITVANKEHGIGHHWPMLQKNVEIGDSVYKAPKDSVIVLVKAKTGAKIICSYSGGKE